MDIRNTLLLLALCCLRVAQAANTLALDINDAMPLRYQQPIESVFIANPEIADYRVINNHQLIIHGRATGQTALLVLDKQGKTLDKRVLVVSRNLEALKQQIQARYPDSTISIGSVGNQVILNGQVDTEETRQDIYTLTGEMLGLKFTEEKVRWKDGDRAGDNIRFLSLRSFEGLVNNLQVSVVHQVNVKLTVAEVSQSFIQQIGVKWGSVAGAGSSILGNGLFFNRLGHLNSKSIGRFISAADDDAMGQILAEPNLSVLSGETASFLAGGEMPIVTFVKDSQNVHYKEFGVRLSLAAKVLKNKTINLTLEPEVSSIDVSNSNNEQGIPAFKTRRAHTTIQLADGESFVLGGLMNSEDREALSKIPLAGDIPIIGAAFRHTDNQRRKTELIIVATVNLVKPVPQGMVHLPRMQRTDTLMRYLNIDSKRKEADSVNRQALDILSSGGFRH